MVRNARNEQEIKRLDQIIVMAENKLGKGKGEALKKKMPGIQELTLKSLLSDNVYPYLSADFFYWEVDYQAWKMLAKYNKGESFPWTQPLKYCRPYSFVFLKEFFFLAENAQCTTSAAEAVADKCKGGDEGWALASQRIEGFYHPIDETSGFRAPLDVRESVHQELVGGRPYLNRCGPFEIPCVFSGDLDSVDFEQCLGIASNVRQQMVKKATLAVGGSQEQVSVALKYRTKATGEVMVSVFLDWPSFTRDGDSFWRNGLLLAWVGLLSWYYSQLCGRRENLAVFLAEHYANRAKFPRLGELYINIDAKLASVKLLEKSRLAQAEEAEKAKTYQVIVQELLEQQASWGLPRGEASVEARVKEKKSLGDKVSLLVDIVKNEKLLYPGGVDEETRRRMVRGTAGRVLEDLVFEILVQPSRKPDAKLAEAKKLFTDLTSPWETVMPFHQRWDVIETVLVAVSAGESTDPEMVAAIQKRQPVWADIVEWGDGVEYVEEEEEKEKDKEKEKDEKDKDKPTTK
ncbi:hypothetical protein M426DRAFT_19219 [Hypoxylon sp. CI-4A]|nr:hypothetical protein M426DRAFT_19219 [Hypoxylon sp. CI-4A]